MWLYLCLCCKWHPDLQILAVLHGASNMWLLASLTIWVGGACVNILFPQNPILYSASDLDINLMQGVIDSSDHIQHCLHRFLQLKLTSSSDTTWESLRQILVKNQTWINILCLVVSDYTPIIVHLHTNTLYTLLSDIGFLFYNGCYTLSRSWYLVSLCMGLRRYDDRGSWWPSSFWQLSRIGWLSPSSDRALWADSIFWQYLEII